MIKKIINGICKGFVKPVKFGEAASAKVVSNSIFNTTKNVSKATKKLSPEKEKELLEFMRAQMKKTGLSKQIKNIKNGNEITNSRLRDPFVAPSEKLESMDSGLGNFVAKICKFFGY